MEEHSWHTEFINILSRIRGCLTGLLIIFVVTCAVGYYFSEAVMTYIFKMVRQVVFISPTEAFVTQIKVSVAIGFILALPAFLFVVVRELAEGNAEFSRKIGMLFAIGGYVLFLLGIMFCFYAILPVALTFLLGFATLEMQPLLSAGRLVSFVLITLMAFGAAFELPVVILFLARLGIVNENSLRQKRKYAILANFIVAGILTPSPDILSQILMAIPLLILYELGIVLTKWWAKPDPNVCAMPPDQQQIYM